MVDAELVLRVGGEDAHPGGLGVEVAAVGDVAVGLVAGARAGREELHDREAEAVQLDQVGQVVGEEHLTKVGRLDAELGREVGQRQPLRVQLEDAKCPGERCQPLGVDRDGAHAGAPRKDCSSATISARTSVGDSTVTLVPSS